MKTLNLAALALLVSALSWSCQPEAARHAETSLVEGSWRWLYAFGGHLEDTTRTLSDSTTILTFEASGVFRLREKTGSEVEGKYSVSGEGMAGWSGETGLLVHFSVPAPLLMDTVFVLHSSADTLRLMTLADDDFDHTFVRLR